MILKDEQLKTHSVQGCADVNCIAEQEQGADVTARAADGRTIWAYAVFVRGML